MTIQRVTGIRRGQVISARFLNGVVDGVNDAIDAVAAPRALLREQQSHSDPANTNARPEDLGTEAIQEADEDVTAAGGDQVWFESERTTSIVRVENPEDPDQYVDVERIDSVTFAGVDGELTLVFNND